MIASLLSARSGSLPLSAVAARGDYAYDEDDGGRRCDRYRLLLRRRHRRGAAVPKGRSVAVGRLTRPRSGGFVCRESRSGVEWDFIFIFHLFWTLTWRGHGVLPRWHPLVSLVQALRRVIDVARVKGSPKKLNETNVIIDKRR